MATPPRSANAPSGTDAQRRTDFLFLLASRVCARVGDGFLRILAVLLVVADSDDPLKGALPLVFRYVNQILINSISGAFIDRMRIRTSMMASDLIRTILTCLLVAAVLLGYPYTVFLVISFLGEFVFIFFKPAVDKVVKVSFPVEEGTKALSRVDAVNHSANVVGFLLASVASAWLGLKVAVFFAPVLFFSSFLLVSRLRLPGEAQIDYTVVRQKSYWASQREGFRHTVAYTPLRILLIGRSIVAIGKGVFLVLQVFYVANLAQGMDTFGYFESSKTIGKVVATALVVPIFFGYRSSFLLTSFALLIMGVGFYCFNIVDGAFLACAVVFLVGMGQASDAVANDALINRYADAQIQGRAKSTTGAGSRIAGLVSIGVVYYLVMSLGFSARTLFAWLGIFPLLAAVVYFTGWLWERKQVLAPSEEGVS
jgi:hypothetical protein